MTEQEGITLKTIILYILTHEGWCAAKKGNCAVCGIYIMKNDGGCFGKAPIAKYRIKIVREFLENNPEFLTPEEWLDL